MLSAIAFQQDAARKARKFLETVKAFAPLFKELEDLDIEPRFSFTDGCIDISFTGDGDRFTKVWGLFRRAGLEPDTRPDPEKTKDGNFSTHWGLMNGPTARLWMYFTSTICKRVQVGTKQVEVPVYETQCGNIDLIEAAPMAPCIEDLPF